MPSKSQVSVEYMLITGFATLLAIPLLLIYYTYSADSTDAVATSQALHIARKIVDASESVYYLGKPSQTTLKLNFPEKIYSTNVSGKELIFKMSTQAGIAEVLQVSPVNMSGTLPKTAGVFLVTIKADENFVQITYN